MKKLRQQDNASPFQLPQIDIPPEFKCPISMELMADPVILVDDNYTYEREYIETYLKRGGSSVSPMTGLPLVHRYLIPNVALKAAIDRLYAQSPLLRNRLVPDVDQRYAQFLERQQEGLEQQKQRRRMPFFAYLQHAEAYLQKRQLLHQHAGINNYDVFISYAWEDQAKKELGKLRKQPGFPRNQAEHRKLEELLKNIEAHKKLQGFLTRLHDDLQRVGLKVFFDCKDMARDMSYTMEKSVAQSGTILSICKPFLQQAVKDKPKGNVALEVNCALGRAVREPDVLLPLLCEGEWDDAIPLQMRGKVVLDAHSCQDARHVFESFDRDQPFSSAYMDWVASRLIPRILRNLGILNDDIWLTSLIQLFHNQKQREKLSQQMSPHEQFEYHYPGSSTEQQTITSLQAFELTLRRLAELTHFQYVSDAKEETPEQEVLLVSPSYPNPLLAAWIARFIRHLELAGLTVSCWSAGSSTFPQQAPRAVIALCTPKLKDIVETGLRQLSLAFSQLQQHLAQPGVVCYPVIYKGKYETAVPDWTIHYEGQWQKAFLARNTEGASLDASKPHYYELMMGINPKGLLRDLLHHEDNDRCYNFLYDNLQMMLAGWGTQELLAIEVAAVQPAEEKELVRPAPANPVHITEITDLLKQGGCDGALPKLIKLDKAELKPWQAAALAAAEKISALLAKNQVLANSLELFLLYVAAGCQEPAEAMLQANPELALMQGTVTDLSGRTFDSITGFQYAFWALDWHMWKMIYDMERPRDAKGRQGYLCAEQVAEQIATAVVGSWVRQHGPRFSFEPLINALGACIKHYQNMNWYQGDKILIQEIGGTQLWLPAHAIHEYCRSDVSFGPEELEDLPFSSVSLSPVPPFLELILPRTMKTGNGFWFVAEYNNGREFEVQGKLGVACGAFRGNCWEGASLMNGVGSGGSFSEAVRWNGYQDEYTGLSSLMFDCESLGALEEIRIRQQEELIKFLKVLERPMPVPHSHTPGVGCRHPSSGIGVEPAIPATVRSPQERASVSAMPSIGGAISALGLMPSPRPHDGAVAADEKDDTAPARLLTSTSHAYPRIHSLSQTGQ